MWRYHPQTRRAAGARLRRRIGALRIVRATFAFSLAARTTDVRWSAELDGGALMDVGCYCVSGLRLLAGEPERVIGGAARRRQWCRASAVAGCCASPVT